MKKILGKILIIAFVLFGTINVYAEEQVTALPKNYSHGGYEFTIEGFELRVYEMNNEDDDDGIFNFVNNNPTKTIALTGSDLTINPQFKEATLNNVPTALVGLNLNLTKEKLESYISSANIKGTQEKSYLTEVVMKYKLTKGKVDSAHIYNFNFAKYFLGSFMPSNDGLKETSLNTTISQVLNIALVAYDNEANESKVMYETTVTEDNDIAAYILNYLVSSTTPLESTNDAVDDILMFYNIDNIDYLVDNLQQIEDDAKGDNGDSMKDVIKNDQVVNVENTAATLPRYFWIVSTMMILLGTGIITYTIVRE